MRRMLFVMLALLLMSGCAGQTDTPNCMAPNESGVVLATQTLNGKQCGYRGGCSDWSSSTVTIRMDNGVSRVCTVPDTVGDMFPKGIRVNLALGKRAL